MVGTSYLVTGGAGFIGSHLVDSLLAGGAQVTVLDNLASGKLDNLNPAARFIQASITDEVAVEAAMQGQHGVFHLAARVSVQDCVDNWMAGHSDNLIGSIHIMKAAAAAGCPLVYASSAAVYGDRSDEVCDEDMQERPISPYGADKLACEHQARAFMEVKGLSSVGLRFFNVYGPRQDPASPYAGVISKFMDNARKKNPHTVYGDGMQSRDFIEVSDVVKGLVSAMQFSRNNPLDAQVINLCTGNETSLLRLIDTVQATHDLGPAVVEHHMVRAGDIRRSVGCTVKAADLLKASSYISLDQGLSRLRESNQAS